MPHKFKASLSVIIAAFLVAGFGCSRSQPPPGVALSLEQKKLQAERDALNKQAQSAAKQDGDLDGLSDVDEKKYGTDPNKPDTDGDGILDKDEINIYKTDPLKFDSYGIGHSDGWGRHSGIILPGGQVDKSKLK